MFLCVGSIPALPNIAITPLVFTLSAFAEAIIQEIATNLFPKLKEWMSMLAIFLVALLGTAGSFGKQGCMATSRATTTKNEPPGSFYISSSYKSKGSSCLTTGIFFFMYRSILNSFFLSASARYL